jgi:hypothetical protein
VSAIAPLLFGTGVLLLLTTYCRLAFDRHSEFVSTHPIVAIVLMVVGWAALMS